MNRKNRVLKKTGVAAQGGGLDTRIGGSISPDFERSPDTNIGHAGLAASNAEAGIADNAGRTPKSTASIDQAGTANKKASS